MRQGCPLLITGTGPGAFLISALRAFQHENQRHYRVKCDPHTSDAASDRLHLGAASRTPQRILEFVEYTGRQRQLSELPEP
jgi:hypothetical protein